MGSDRAEDRGRFRLLLVVGVLAASVATAGVCSGGQKAPSEYAVKAAIVYNVLKFVEWPRTAAASPDVRICLAGDLPDESRFLDLERMSQAGRRVRVTRADAGSVRECHVLFVAGRDEQLPPLLEAAAGAPVLIISERAGAARRGAVINFIIVDRKVAFQINLEAARRAGLQVSSKLLKLAHTVFDREPAGE